MQATKGRALLPLTSHHSPLKFLNQKFYDLWRKRLGKRFCSSLSAFWRLHWRHSARPRAWATDHWHCSRHFATSPLCHFVTIRWYGRGVIFRHGWTRMDTVFSPRKFRVFRGHPCQKKEFNLDMVRKKRKMGLSSCRTIPFSCRKDLIPNKALLNLNPLLTTTN